MSQQKQPPKQQDPNVEKQSPEKLHWLVRPATIKGLWVGGIILLVWVTWLGTTVHPHIKFGLEGTITFYAWYGFVTCVGMVLFAKLIVGKLLGRKDTFYDH